MILLLTWQANVTHRGSVDGKTKNVIEMYSKIAPKMIT